MPIFRALYWNNIICFRGNFHSISINNYFQVEHAQGFKSEGNPQTAKTLFLPIKHYSLTLRRKSYREIGQGRHEGPLSLRCPLSGSAAQTGVESGESPREEERKGGQMYPVPMAWEGATTPNNPVSLLRRFQRAFTARLATHSNVESPSSRLRIPNSTRREPAPAVHVSLLLSGGTPVFRFTWGQEETKDLGQDLWGTLRARRPSHSH